VKPQHHISLDDARWADLRDIAAFYHCDRHMAAAAAIAALHAAVCPTLPRVPTPPRRNPRGTRRPITAVADSLPANLRPKKDSTK
jgi:hypothetical protein